MHCKLFIVSIFLLSFSTTVVQSDVTGINNCESVPFKSLYYKLDVENVSDASLFFRSIPITYFEKNNLLFVVKTGEIERVETYFDDSDLSLLKNNKELLLTENKNLPNYRVGREQVLFSDYSIVPSQFSHFEVKHYNKKVAALDKHALFGIVKRNQRQALLDKIHAISVVPAKEFSEKLNVHHQEVVQLYTHFGESYGAITFDNFEILNFGILNTNYLLKFELYTEKINKLQEQEKKYLIQSFCRANDNLKKNIPGIKSLTRFGYSSYNKLAEEILPSRVLFNKYPLLFSIGQILVLLFIGFLFIHLLTGRYTRRKNYRNVMSKGGRFDDR